jgi:hypothetical protein
MTPARRIALLAAVVVVAVVGFIVLKPDEGSKKQSSEPTATTTPARTDTGKGRTTPAHPPSPPVANVQVRNGKPVGGVRKLEFSKGEQVEFFVTSDVADHVHVHGYDLMKDVEPGTRVKFKFKARLDGVYEIELEDRALEIASLRVNP